MADSRTLLAEALRHLDDNAKVQRHEVLALFNPAAAAATEEGVRNPEVECEVIAAELCLYDEPCRWSTYHGPWASGVNEAGETIDSPPLEAITAECVDYWRGRMTTAKHPVIRARYADLVWEFSKHATGDPPPIEAARTAIDGYVEAVVTNKSDAFAGLGDPQLRAMRLAASVGDKSRLDDAVSKFEKHTNAGSDEADCEYRKRVLIGQLGQLHGKLRPALSLASLADDLRTRLGTLVADGADQFAIGNVATPLADYFWSEQKRDECYEVLRIHGDAVRRDSEGAMGALAVAWLTQLRNVYLRHEMLDDAADVLRLIESRQSEVPDNLVPISIPHEVDQVELTAWLDWLVDDDPQASTLRLLGQFVTGVDEAREQMKQIQQDHPLSSLFTSTIVDHQGRSVAEVGPAGTDDEGALVRHLHQGMQFSDFYLASGLGKLLTTHYPDAEALCSVILVAPVWHPDRHKILRRAITAYYDDDPIVCVHLLVSEIENAVRSLSASRGGVLQKPNRLGGFDFKNLGDLLASEEMSLFLGEDLSTYLKIALTDRRGWNLRNNTCHGLVPASSLSAPAARRLLHIVLLLSQVKAGASAPAAGHQKHADAQPEEDEKVHSDESEPGRRPNSNKGTDR